ATYVATTADTASYSYASGTSFSCPLTAGAVGLLVQAHPDWTPIEIIEALRSTATQSSAPDTLMGWGIAQAYDARYADWAGVDGSQAAVPRVVWASPNPSSHGTKVQFVLNKRGRAVVAVYNASGGLVRALVDRVLPSGPHAVEWDGRDETGQPVASGVYFAKLRAAGGVRSSAKVVVVR
ncbi:MAG TPA: S8 family serine peptidase, partial [bacterium]|nr:S8 family serine peptidase [bacterium]